MPQWWRLSCCFSAASTAAENSLQPGKILALTEELLQILLDRYPG